MYLNNLFNLKGKVAVVIGGGGYLCKIMSYGLSKAGCKLAILDLRYEKAKKVSEQIKSNGSEAIALSIDVTKKESHLEALDQIIKKYGKVDVLINGAGINGSTPFLDIDSKEWYSIIDSQLTGTFYGCQVFGEQMLKNNSGSIINISSASAGPPLSKAFTYSASKAGIKNLTQNLGREWGEKGVRVNALRPGFFPTEWNKKNFITKDREIKILGHTPMNRYGKPEELIGAVLWLSSDASSFVTGAEIAVDGGYSCMTI